MVSISGMQPRIKIELGSVIDGRLKAKIFSLFPIHLPIRGVYRSVGRLPQNNLRR